MESLTNYTAKTYQKYSRCVIKNKFFVTFFYWLYTYATLWDFAPGAIRWPGLEVKHLHSFNAEFKNRWNCTSASPACLRSVRVHNFTFVGLYVSHFLYRCPRRNVQYFGRVFLMLNYTDITQNTYIQSWTVMEIMAREVWNFDSCYTLIDYQIHIETGRNMWFL